MSYYQQGYDDAMSKLGYEKKALSDNAEHARNVLVGGVGGAANPLLAGILASATKPEGDDTSQFWGTLGGSLAGQLAGGGIGRAISSAGRGSPVPTVVGALSGGALGGYGAQRLMALRRAERDAEVEAATADSRRK
jgi:hypothetical protein